MRATPPGSGKWRISAWPDLLRSAIGLIDGLPDAPRWSFGGGTSLAVQFDHRISHDVDVFLRDPDAMAALSPNRNPATRTLLAGRKYEYPGNYLKLYMEEGEIDFILSGSRTARPLVPWSFEGREIPTDAPWETAAKKMFYRPSSLKVRDVFDLAAVLEVHPEEVAESLPDIEDRLPRLIDRVDLLRPDYERLVERDVNPTEKGERFMTRDAIEGVAAFLSERYARMRGRDDRAPPPRDPGPG